LIIIKYNELNQFLMDLYKSFFFTYILNVISRTQP